MAIRQATIAKYHNFLKDIVDKADGNMIIHDFYSHVSNHKLNNAVGGELQRLGYIVKVSGLSGAYEVKLVKPEPKHARTILEKLNVARNNTEKEKTEKVTKPVKKVTAKKVRVKKDQIHEYSKKEFSILWGLIFLKW